MAHAARLVEEVLNGIGVAEAVDSLLEAKKGGGSKTLAKRVAGLTQSMTGQVKGIEKEVAGLKSKDKAAGGDLEAALKNLKDGLNGLDALKGKLEKLGV